MMTPPRSLVLPVPNRACFRPSIPGRRAEMCIRDRYKSEVLAMNAVIYARYSSDNQREESIEGQIRECTAYAERNGITVVRCV